MMKSLIQRLHLIKFTRVAEYLVALALLGVATLLCEVLASVLFFHNLLVIYLVTVVIAALKLSLQSTLLTVLGGAIIYNYLYVPPRFDFNFEKKEYLATFFGFLVIGVVVSSLVKKVRDRNLMLEAKDTETSSLYDLSRKLTTARDQQTIISAVVEASEQRITCRTAFFIRTNNQLSLAASSSSLVIEQNAQAVINAAFQFGKAAEYISGEQAGSILLCVPILSSQKTVGVLVADIGGLNDHDRVRRLLDAFAGQAGMALERVTLVHEVEQAKNMAARQKLERALLNSVSHDLRTPLATITGVLSSLIDEEDVLNDQMRHELLINARTEANRLNRFVGKLLDVTRLEAGGVVLKMEPCDVQELVGCALAAVEQQLMERQVHIQMDAGMPLVLMDMVLLNQVLINLLDNAIKYSPLGSEISIVGTCDQERFLLKVIDQGMGVPDSELNKIFEKFYRIAVPESIGGTGLGLTICRGIVEAHGGAIWASNCPGGDFCIAFWIPLQSAGEKENTS